MAKIVGGSNAVEDRYPYAAAVFGSTNEISAVGSIAQKVEEEYLCGGSLISDRAVITASSCVNDVSSMFVALGCSNLATLANCTIARVLEIESFPETNTVQTHDLAILILASTVNIRPVALPSTRVIPTNGDFVKVLGWGETLNRNTPTGEDLQEGDVLIVEGNICLQQMKSASSVFGSSRVGFENNENLNNIVCTISDGVSACNKDQGSPLIYPCEFADDLLLGLFSFGISCGGEGIPVAYQLLNTETARNFIDGHLQKRGFSTPTYIEAFNEPIDSDLRNQQFCFGQILPREFAPTPFPTFLANQWTCELNSFASNDGCHCECGLPDPDCEVHTSDAELFGCPDTRTQFCDQGVCATKSIIPEVNPSPVDPADNATEVPTFPETEAPTNSPTLLPTLSPTINITSVNSEKVWDLVTIGIVGSFGLVLVLLFLALSKSYKARNAKFHRARELIESGNMTYGRGTFIKNKPDDFSYQVTISHI